MGGAVAVNPSSQSFKDAILAQSNNTIERWMKRFPVEFAPVNLFVEMDHLNGSLISKHRIFLSSQ